jgi:NitT/TauT family transport system permease protein
VAYRDTTMRFLRALAVPITLVLLWEGLSRAGVFNQIILPAPSRVVVRWIEYARSGELPHDAISSLYRVMMGFLIGTLLALPLGLAMGASRKAYGLLNPVLQVLRPIPPIAYVPLAILWFGLGNPPAFFLISLGAFFPVLMNTIAGVRSVDAVYIRAARNLGAGNRALFFRVVVPAAMPHIMTGIRVGFGVAFIVVIVAEMIAVNNGLGYRILEAREFFWSDKIIAGMFTIGLLGLGIDAMLARLSDYLLRWHRGLEPPK